MYKGPKACSKQILLRQHFVYPRLVLNLLQGWEWPWISEPPVSTSQGSKACAPMPTLFMVETEARVACVLGKHFTHWALSPAQLNNSEKSSLKLKCIWIEFRNPTLRVFRDLRVFWLYMTIEEWEDTVLSCFIVSKTCRQEDRFRQAFFFFFFK